MQGAFCLYAGFNGVATVMIFFCVPGKLSYLRLRHLYFRTDAKDSTQLETKQRTLEELDYVFAVPFRTFAKYQTFTWLPYIFKRYILFQKNAQLKPLYHFDKVDRHHHQSKLGGTNDDNGTESKTVPE